METVTMAFLRHVLLWYIISSSWYGSYLCCFQHMLRKVEFPGLMWPLTCTGPNHTCSILPIETQQCWNTTECYGFVKYSAEPPICSQCTPMEAGASVYRTSPDGDLFVLNDKPAGGGWEMIFKVSKGNNQPAYDLWDGGSASGSSDGCNSDPGAICSEHYKSERVDTWGDINEVRMEMYQDGVVVAVAAFNGSGSSKSDWLSHDRILYSSWEDVESYTDTTTISVSGSSLTKSKVRFAMNTEIPGMQYNRGGWMHVLELEDRDFYQVTDHTNQPWPGTVGPLLRYSRRPGRIILLTDPNGIFHTISPARGGYDIPYSEYVDACHWFGASVCTYDDLVESFNDGLQNCAFARTTDSSGCYYLNQVNSSCGTERRFYKSTRFECNAWCKQNTSDIGEADTMVISVR